MQGECHAYQAQAGNFNPGSLASDRRERADYRLEDFGEPFISSAHAQSVDWQKSTTLSAASPRFQVMSARYGFPRGDLTVTLDDVTIKPALALGGWVAFKPMHGGAMVMGDLVLLQTEVRPVMAKMIEGGLDITAVHNHLLRANPETFYMHVAGQGDPVKLAAVIHDALATSKTPLTVAAAASPPAIDLDTAQLDQIIGVKGQNNGGVYAFAVRDVTRSAKAGWSWLPSARWASRRVSTSADRRRQGGDYRRFCIDG